MISHLFISEREATKDESTLYSALDRSYLEQQICGSALIFCIVRKTGPMLPLLMGFMAGRLADEMRIDFKNFKLFYSLNSLDFTSFEIVTMLL